MKILHLVKVFHQSKGGMETYVRDIVSSECFANSGLDFSILCFGELNMDTSLNFKGIEVSVHICKPWFYYKKQPIGFPFLRFWRLVKRHTLIHHHYPFPIFELMLFLIPKKKYIVTTWHGNIEQHRWRNFSSVYNLFIKLTLFNSNKIIVTSKSVFLNSKFLNRFEKKVVVIPIAFHSIYKFKPRKYPSNLFRILFVGKLRLYKGVAVLLHAVRYLNVSLTIVGDGEELDNLRNLVSDLELDAKVTFKKELSDQELDNEYKNADLFILPSINEGEAFGIVQLEAMAYGLPVINTNVNSGVPFVSLNEITGITVEPNCIDCLTAGITKIIDNPELYEFYSANALMRIMDFNPKEINNKLLNIYLGLDENK